MSCVQIQGLYLKKNVYVLFAMLRLQCTKLALLFYIHVLSNLDLKIAFATFDQQGFATSRRFGVIATPLSRD